MKPRLLQSVLHIFEDRARNADSYGKNVTDKNPHKFKNYEVAPGFFILAVNEESARMKYERIMKKKDK